MSPGGEEEDGEDMVALRFDIAADKMAAAVRELGRRFKKQDLPPSTRVSVTSNVMAFSVTVEVDLEALEVEQESEDSVEPAI